MSQVPDTERPEIGRLFLGMEDLPDAAIRCGEDGTIEEMNSKAASLLGLNAENAIGLGFPVLAVPAEDCMSFAIRFQDAAAGVTSGWIGHRLLRHGGTFWAETSLAASPGSPGTLVHIRDASRAKLKDQMATIQSAITAILAHSRDLDSAIPQLLAAACQHPPWDVGSYWSVSVPDGILRCEHQFSSSPDTTAGFRKRSFEIAMRPGEGLPGRVLASGAPEWMDDIHDKASFIRAKEAEAAGLHTGFAFPVVADGKVSGLFEFFTTESSPVDAEFMAVTESMAGQVSRFISLKKAEQDLAHKSAENSRSLDQLSVILQGAADGIAAWSPEGLLIYCNSAYARILGKDSAEGLAGLPMHEVRDALDARDLDGAPIAASELPTAVALRGATVRAPMRVRMPASGEERWVNVHSAPVFGEDGEVKMAIIVLHDRTEQIKMDAERKASEERRHQSQKMEAMGRLAGGIAHDFNNLLTAINGYSDLLADSLPKESREEGFSREIRKAGERAAALTQQLLAYSRKQVLQKKVFALDDTLRDMETLLRRLIGEDIALQVDAGSDGAQVEMDPGQLEQIILNLAINSRDAMPKGGTLRLESIALRMSGGELPGLPEMRPGEYIRLRITDSGTGMDEETMAHLFEPFFTTKEQGKGTGLGLSTVFGIVNQAEGQIEVESAAGRGTRFDVYIPALPKGTIASVKPPDQVAQETVGSLETILLVEDEAMVRNFICLVLKSAGFKVLEASNGLEALVLQRSFAGPIRMLLSDVVMPSMGGEDLADALRQERPGTQVLFVSGYDAHGGIAERLGNGTAFLKKPFTAGVLLEKVRELLAIPAV